MQLSESEFTAQIPILFRHFIGLIPNRINPFFGIKTISDKSIIRTFDSWNVKQQQQFVFRNIKQNVEDAYSKIPFYNDYYSKNGFHPSFLKSFDDIQLIPRINKGILLEYPIDQRCRQIKGAVKVNTGGSSGKTLAFYQNPLAKKYHEEIHMTAIWEKIGYKYSDLKLTMAGLNNVRNGVDFCFHTNSLRLDIYNEFSQIAPKLKQIANKRSVRFLHGYPSLFYEFAVYCEEHDHELREILRKSLKGAFLGSEYPHAKFRDKIEDVFSIPSVNWYGHTEGAVLAYEKVEKFRFYPFQTYGFAEMTTDGHLLGSTYYNNAGPLIRYDTEDIISDAEIKNGFIVSFRIEDGRNGEFIIDRNGKKISLTGLIFGRHHNLFDFCSHLQISQRYNGQATVIYVLKDKNTKIEPGYLFDSSNIAIEFVFKGLDHPIKTKAGKLNLLIRPDQLEENG